MSGVIIAIDGPAAAGKGTLAAALARHFGLPHLDTGLLYRAVGRQMLCRGLDPSSNMAGQIAASLQPQDLQRDDLRVPEVDRAASLVAVQPDVRAALLQRQRDFALMHGAVMDGRDIGTSVFPNADVKFFVTASARTRAVRRFRQYHPGQPINEIQVQKLELEIAERDRIDSGRAISPLRQAEDAVVIETDDREAQDVLALAIEIVTSTR